MKVCLSIAGVILIVAAVVMMSVHPVGVWLFVPALLIFGRLLIKAGND